MSKIEPVAHMWQHGETGMTGFVEHASPEDLAHWERMNRPRQIVATLYTASQLEQYKADAERYRWIRARSREEMMAAGVDLSWYVPTEGLDAAIDAARSKND